MKSVIIHLDKRHELELEWDEEEGWFFEGFTFDDGFQFYSNFRSHVPGNLHPPIAPAFATWWDKKERKAAAFALETHKKVANRQQLRDAIKEIGIPESVLAQEARKHEHQRIPSPMSKGEIEAEECSIRDENVRLWDLLKRTRKHRDKLLRNLRNEISDIHAGKFMAKMGRTRDHIDKLHTEINKLEQRKLELKATIMMMGGSEYK